MDWRSPPSFHSGSCISYPGVCGLPQDLQDDSFQEFLFSVNYFCRLRRLFLPVHLLFLTPFLSHSGAVAVDVEFQDDRVVDHPVDGRRGCH